jgi:hypothetical protein
MEIVGPIIIGLKSFQSYYFAEFAIPDLPAPITVCVSIFSA